MRLSHLAALSLSLLGGCVLVFKDGGRGDHGHYGGDWEDQDSWSGETAGDTAAAVETTWLLTPNTVGPGETKILSLTADPVFDYSTIANVEFYGGVSVCTFEARDTELLITVTAPTTEGPEDMLLVLADGSTLYVADALTVAAGSANDPTTGTDANGNPTGGGTTSGGCGG